ncbi:MAG: ABC transporter permease [Ruminococcus sp.]|nr:ABC transporter permease [Ruminococcus sp.]
MLFKLGLKNLRHNLLMNILTILQMTVAFVILIAMISTIVSRFRHYIPIKEFLNSKGYFYNIQYGINPETGLTLRTTDEIHDLIEGEDVVAAQYTPWLTYSPDGQEVRTEDENSISDHFVSYDDIYAEIFTPELESGRWFDLKKPVGDEIQVVVSKNDYGLKTGDKISLFCFDSEVKAEIIGVLKDNTKIIDQSTRSVEKIDYRNFYNDFKLEREEAPVFLMLQKELIDKPVVMQLCGNVFVTYPDGASPETIERGNQTMKQLHTAYTSSTENMKKNSLDHIFSQIYNLMPIFICIFILTLVGAVSTSALSAKRQLKNYAVYYVCGLKWKQCAAVNLFSSLVSVTISFILSLGGIFIAKAVGILGNTVIEFGIWQIAGCAVIMIIYVLMSIILPLNIIGNNTPNQVLKSN